MQKAQETGLQNVRFIYGIVHHIEKRFLPKSIDSLRIVHPDPRPRERDAKRRLTHPRFLTSFDKLLKNDGILHLKTDAHDLFDYSCEQLRKAGWICVSQTHDLHRDPELLANHHGIRTHYEKL
jgi:tRNA (guanine-N7-)-methyltransferase